MMVGVLLRKKSRRARACSALVPVFLLTGALDAAAQNAAAPPPPAAPPPAVAPGQNTMITLIQQLVQEGVLTQERAQALINQARDEAATAARGAPAVAPAAATPSTSVRVPYIPQIVKNQIFDLANAAGTPPAIHNTTEDRQRMRIRLRLGMNVDVADGLVAGIRLATGNTTNPVTTNQTLGTTLNKQNFLLDRAFLDYHPADWIELWVGRFANPWLSTEMVWDDDINFDGVAGRFRANLTDNFSLSATGGAFPIENTAFNFPDNTVTKVPSRDKWLFAGQLGMDFQPARNFDFKLAAAYFHYQNVQGALSAPCVANSSADPCSTDNSRPGFQQTGNTSFAIRNLVSNAANPPLFQYYGLSSAFHDLDITARLDYAIGSIHAVVDGDVVKNLAFSRNRILGTTPLNNIDPTINGVAGAWDGGSLGYHVRLTVGYPEIHERWQWNTSFGYRHIDSDATPDAFNDSDFHEGGTNAKGYVVSTSIGIAHNTDLTAKWLSASEVTGLPYTVDVVQVDLNARF